MEVSTRLFVYGTLLEGEPNHAELRGARLVVPDVRTRSRYALVDLGLYPGLVAGRQVVHGELYEATEALLADLDAFEGSAYARGLVELEDGPAVAYFLIDAAAGCHPTIRSGRWRGQSDRNRPVVADESAAQ